MKRSKKAALVLMVPATTLLLVACGEKPEQGLVYSNAAECAAASYNSQEQCEADFAAAQALHPQVAPKYLNQAECEADFGAGQCEIAPQQTQAGGSVFMPMMMGYLAGQMMSRASGTQNFNQTGAGFKPSSVPTQPLYKSRDDRSTFRTASNSPVASGVGPVSLLPSQVKPQPGRVVRRGGFGQFAAVNNSHGG